MDFTIGSSLLDMVGTKKSVPKKIVFGGHPCSILGDSPVVVRLSPRGNPLSFGFNRIEFGTAKTLVIPHHESKMNSGNRE